ncbi:MAG TPA: hypothetical protein DD400_01050, partial [Rhodospirillaceae bacterium]|nr:hypothetical protein [Rhodospirillaceae bacterium]
KMVVGTHFFQTNPKFIEKFINSKHVNFILQTNGIYHPKVYLFSDNIASWECIIGSANFTYSALTKNSEIVVHIKSGDSNSEEIYHSIIETINEYWESSDSITQNEYENYKKNWQKNQKKVKTLKGEYGKSKSKKPVVKSNLFSLNWVEYYKLIQKDKFHSFSGRIQLLKTANKYFSSQEHFSNLTQVERREIAGVATSNQTDKDIDWGWFGSMVGAGRFQNRINSNNQFISKSLDSIPLKGKVNRSNYTEFVNTFHQAFPDGGSGVAIASRLLAIKRPDYFVCLDRQNKVNLCNEFGLPQTISFDSYWDDIIERILDSVWWSSEKPNIKTQSLAWRCRAAMLDALFFEEK